MSAVDPTYPLYPVASILSSALLLLVLITSFARQNWNLGVAFLCFWLFWENLTHGIDAVVWSDNYAVKLFVYCDFVSHLHAIAFVVKPMSTLIIVRRLYLIASLRSVELPSTREKRNNMIIEWTLGLIIPLIVAGPLYYVVQLRRFQVLEGSGCADVSDNSILPNFLLNSWSIVPPLVSIAVYYPKVIWVFYRQRRDTNRFLRSNNSISRTNYFRILALASIDLLFTFPLAVANTVIANVQSNEFYKGHIPFYSGWEHVHANWAPIGIPYSGLRSAEAAALLRVYFSNWSSPVLGFIIFGFFGLTEEARTTYWRAICMIGKWLGWKPTLWNSAEQHTLGPIEFGKHMQEIPLDVELGLRPSFVNVNFEPVVAANPNNAGGVEKGESAPKALDSINSFVTNVDTPPNEQSQA